MTLRPLLPFSRGQLSGSVRKRLLFPSSHLYIKYSIIHTVCQAPFRQSCKISRRQLNTGGCIGISCQIFFAIFFRMSSVSSVVTLPSPLTSAFSLP